MHELERQLAQEGARLDGVYCCPHGDDDGCDCRKPLPGMLRQAQCDHGLDLCECYVVGDAGAWDMMMARDAGCSAVLVRTGLGESSLAEYRHTWAGIEPDFVADDVLRAAEWIAEREAGRRRPLVVCSAAAKHLPRDSREEMLRCVSMADERTMERGDGLGRQLRHHLQRLVRPVAGEGVHSQVDHVRQ